MTDKVKEAIEMLKKMIRWRVFDLSDLSIDMFEDEISIIETTIAEKEKETRELKEENNRRKDAFMMEHRLTIALQNEKKILQAEIKQLKKEIQYD